MSGRFHARFLIYLFSLGVHVSFSSHIWQNGESGVLLVGCGPCHLGSGNCWCFARSAKHGKLCAAIPWCVPPGRVVRRARTYMRGC